ncbi:hypothetical protein R5R35_014493 [Gryllus longicercus]|uniref:Uncharacterized protein n=1 Tax=Gryllus longicercus TaxID=2509291 RepID=A0AAN9V899_9ORTH
MYVKASREVLLVKRSSTALFVRADADGSRRNTLPDHWFADSGSCNVPLGEEYGKFGFYLKDKSNFLGKVIYDDL